MEFRADNQPFKVCNLFCFCLCLLVWLWWRLLCKDLLRKLSTWWSQRICLNLKEDQLLWHRFENIVYSLSFLYLLQFMVSDLPLLNWDWLRCSHFNTWLLFFLIFLSLCPTWKSCFKSKFGTLWNVATDGKWVWTLCKMGCWDAPDPVVSYFHLLLIIYISWQYFGSIGLSFNTFFLFLATDRYFQWFLLWKF